MINLREKIVSHNKKFIEGKFGLPCILIDPNDGVKRPYRGQVIYHTADENPETGAKLITDMAVLTLHRASLNRIPLAGETWVFGVPKSPKETAITEWYVTGDDLPPQDGSSIGFIRLYGTRTKQS